MSFEDLQKVWQRQNAGAVVTVDANLALREIRRNHLALRTTLFWRDLREVGVAFVLAWYFIWRGLRNHDVTDGVMALVCFGIGAFMLGDRLVQRKRRPAANDSLKDWVDSSLHEVNHQIWLLKNVGWWYLLPFAAAWGLSIGVSIWHAPHSGVALKGYAVYLVSCFFFFWFIYWLNQMAVKKTLMPRRQELEAWLAALE